MGSTCRTRRALHTDKVETQQEQSGACIMRIHAVQAQGTQCIGLKSVQPRMANMCSQIANPEVKRLISADDILRHYRSKIDNHKKDGTFWDSVEKYRQEMQRLQWGSPMTIRQVFWRSHHPSCMRPQHKSSKWSKNQHQSNGEDMHGKVTAFQGMECTYPFSRV
ncbi:hypothetical protein WJX77_009172 [Trebouxia sp. C0004]